MFKSSGRVRGWTMQWAPDRGLQLRMALALALVAVMPLTFVTSMTWALNAIVLALASELFETGPLHVRVPLLPVLGLTLLGFAVSYTVGDRLALRSTGARRVTGADWTDLYARIGRLATTAGMPSPDLAIIESDVPNAFATGRSRQDATVAVTTGLVETLDDDELDAVLAHELAHVRNRDATVMTIAYLLPTVTYYVAITAYRVLSVFGRGSSGCECRVVVTPGASRRSSSCSS